MDNSLKP